MITAVDTNVLIDVFGADEKYGPSSRDALRASLDAGRIVVCDIVWAETTAAFRGEDDAGNALRTLGADFVATDPSAASAAGEAWRRYRRSGGPRTRVIADFLVAAHALYHADRLLTRDRGFFGSYFPTLTLVEPGDAS
ncbi:type II toxin-antitoxin system VapC family toxin [Pseudonocardia acaciae]|uniref:type II toxin-antitoxin system VapC family toxin n=1 Tax=Pseudonocardia acaciae TaxID=551276 RepID=UPI000684412A|nr:PIN domain-containing protein [Pseudonocardia acaciae]